MVSVQFHPSFKKVLHPVALKTMAPVPLFCGDSVRFSAQTQKLDMKSIVKVPEGSQVSPAFVQRVESATERVLMSFPKAIRDVLIKQGHTICPITHILESSDPKEVTDKQLNLFKTQLTPESLEKILPELNKLLLTLKKRCTQNAAVMSRLITLEQSLTSGHLTDEFFRAFAWLYIGLNGKDNANAFYDPSKKKIYVIDNKVDWEQKPEKLERFIRHEFWHLIDYVIGEDLNGQPFSQSSNFQQVALEDIQIGKSTGRCEMELLTMMDSAGYFFPIRVANSSTFTEAFAEIASSTHGGGALPAERLIKEIFQKSLQFLRTQIFPQIGSEHHSTSESTKVNQS